MRGRGPTIFTVEGKRKKHFVSERLVNKTTQGGKKKNTFFFEELGVIRKCMACCFEGRQTFVAREMSS